MNHKNMETLQQGLDHIRQSPSDSGTLKLIVARPAEDQRLEMEEGTLDVAGGLIGDNWESRGSSKTVDGSALPEAQITLMNTRVLEIICDQESDWKLAGDQLYGDMDLSKDNLPPGTKIFIGETELEVTPEPHTGCEKFSARYGLDALKFISNKEGRSRQMRGIYLKVLKGGTIRKGDQIIKQ